MEWIGLTPETLRALMLAIHFPSVKKRTELPEGCQEGPGWTPQVRREIEEANMAQALQEVDAMLALMAKTPRAG
jgi:hypothetical protein